MRNIEEIIDLQVTINTNLISSIAGLLKRIEKLEERLKMHEEELRMMRSDDE